MGNDTMENAKYAHQFGHINFLLWDWALQLSAKNVVRMCIFAQGDGKFQFPRDSDFKDEIQAYEVDLPGATVENRTIRRILKELLQRQWNTDFQLRDRPDDVRTFVCDQWAKFYEFRQQLKIRVKLLRSKVVGRKSLSGTEVLDIIQAIYPFDEKYVCQAHRCLEHHVFLSHRQKFHGLN